MSTAYRPLNDGTLPGVLAPLKEVSERLGGDFSQWSVQEVGDGNLNLVFIVGGPRGAVIVKQALPYVRLVGDSWPLPLSRSYYEHLALVEQTKHVPKLVPKIFHYDRNLALIVMEYLTPHIIMRKGLIRGIEYPRFAGHIAEFMAQTLFKTSALAVPAAEHKRRIWAFADNIELCKITEDLVFTDPYRVAKLNRWTAPYLDEIAARFRADAALKVAVQRRKLQFLTSPEAMIHGDLHTGSIMLTPEDTRVIDPEFAFMGPIGFDVGAVLGNLLIAYYSQEGHEGRPGSRTSYRHWILVQTEQVWRLFAKRFRELWDASKSGDAYMPELFTDAPGAAAFAAEKDRFMRALFVDSVSFAGIKMIRRILGLAHTEDLESIQDEARRARCEIKALTLAHRLIIEADKFTGISDVTSAARGIFAAH
ncbi:S-methyl-5-thioribose kinase [Taklimakanibacter lacteus]|uniref:S-methyl-5-thioribose kinase n=1 Tax=Taklimakanibacter lacteus TaxID=2268456 RepID=UPI000E672D8D